MEKLILKLTRVNEDGERVLCEEEMDSVAIIGGCQGNKILELLADVSIREVSEMIMQSTKLIKAAKLAVIGQKILSAFEDLDPEQKLADQIDGGLQ